MRQCVGRAERRDDEESERTLHADARAERVPLLLRAEEGSSGFAFSRVDQPFVNPLNLADSFEAPTFKGRQAMAGFECRAMFVWCRSSSLRMIAITLTLGGASALQRAPQSRPAAGAGRRALLTSAVGLGLASPFAAPAREPAFDRIATEAPVLRDGDVPFAELPSGVKVKLMRAGPGLGDTVEAGRSVVVEMTALALNLNGKPFFSTKLADGTPEPLSWTIGDGRAVPGLEEGMIGMRKGDVRRIIVPPARGYAAPRTGTDPFLPVPRSVLDQRALDSIIKNPNRDATVLFDVRVDRIR